MDIDKNTYPCFQVVSIVEVQAQAVSDLLVTAINGGMSDHWALHRDLEIIEAKVTFNVDGMWEIPFIGGSFRVYDRENPDDLLGFVNMDRIKIALNYMANGRDRNGKDIPLSHWKNLIDDNADGETADVFYQLVVMGEIVFG